MKKKQVLETISYPQRRIKLSGNWFTVSPFIELDKLTFGKEYEATYELEKETWYISELKEIV